MENHHAINGKTRCCYGPFSIANCSFTRGYLHYNLWCVVLASEGQTSTFSSYSRETEMLPPTACCISYLQFQWILIIFPSNMAIWCYLGMPFFQTRPYPSMCVCAQVIILCQIDPMSYTYHSTWAGQISYVPTWLLIVARCRLSAKRGAYLLWCPMNIVSHASHIQKNYISISKNKARWGRRRTSHCWITWWPVGVLGTPASLSRWVHHPAKNLHLWFGAQALCQSNQWSTVSPASIIVAYGGFLKWGCPKTMGFSKKKHKIY